MSDQRTQNATPSEAPAPRPRRGGAQRVFAVTATERLSPQLVRLHLGGDDFDGFVADADPARIAATDKYVKMLFAKPGSDLVPPYDLDVLRETHAPEDLPVQRTYTVRSVDREARTIAIDFVVHGTEGVAGPWAANAQPGDLVALSGPGGAYAPTGGDVTTVYVGDESAIPAIASALEALADDPRGIALIEVEDAAGEIALVHPTGVEVRWLHRATATGHADHGVPLVAAVEALARPAGAVEVFAHGEREAMKRLRAVFHGVWGVERDALSLSAYWARGRTEDRFQAEKREPIGQIFTD